MAQVVLKQVVKTFDRQTVIQNLNLTIPDGSFTVMVGPSGCGKSTTLRMIAGLETVTKGEIWIGEQKVNDLPPGKRDLAMVFQNYALYPTMTVKENIEFGLKNRKVPKKEREQLIQEIAETVGLGDYLQRKPSTLSGGQRQRVALARAMVKKPKVFLMDEPLSNLDAKLRHQMRAELIELHKQLGTTFIYVTHDQVEAMSMGDQIVVMDQGAIQQTASPIELYHDPANLFVAQFIGTPPMNLLRLPDRPGMQVGIRPERVLLTRENGKAVSFHPELQRVHDARERISIQGLIQGREVLGAETIYKVQTDLGLLTVKSHSDDLLTKDETVTVQLLQQDLYFFDAVHGQRVTEKVAQDPGPAEAVEAVEAVEAMGTADTADTADTALLEAGGR